MSFTNSNIYVIVHNYFLSMKLISTNICIVILHKNTTYVTIYVMPGPYYIHYVAGKLQVNLPICKRFYSESKNYMYNCTCNSMGKSTERLKLCIPFSI